MSSATTSLLSAVGLGAFFVAKKYLGFDHDSQEPPVAPGAVPVAGHSLRLRKEKYEFYPNASRETQAPIYTVLLPGQKMYIITTTDLIQKVERSKTLSWRHISVKFATILCGVSKDAKTTAYKNPNGDEGPESLQLDSEHAFHLGVKPGMNLDITNRVMMKELCVSLDAKEPAVGASNSFQLYAWLRQTLTIATTNSIYGKMNPYRDPEVVDAYWEFDEGMLSLLLYPYPTLLARKAVKARTRVAKAFEYYFRNGGVEESSPLMKLRYDAERKNGLSIEDMALYEVGGSIAVLVNTVPASFWLMFLICADPVLLADIRKEVDAITTVQSITDSNGKTTQNRNIDITGLTEKCKLLASTFQEVLRWRSMGASLRDVTADTLLDGKWLLKKGAMVQMPSRVIHTDKSIWGPDVMEFNPRRFMKPTNPGVKQIASKNFRGFGGGSSLCPGRHFASNEVLALVATFVARYDMRPANGAAWTTPTTWETKVSSVVMEPDTDVDVEITRRPEFENCRWSISLTTSENPLALVEEDQTQTPPAQPKQQTQQETLSTLHDVSSKLAATVKVSEVA